MNKNGEILTLRVLIQLMHAMGWTLWTCCLHGQCM